MMHARRAQVDCALVSASDTNVQWINPRFGDSLMLRPNGQKEAA